jgi:hypothetical protein
MSLCVIQGLLVVMLDVAAPLELFSYPPIVFHTQSLPTFSYILMCFLHSSALPNHVLHENFHLLRAVLGQDRQQIIWYRLLDSETLCPLFHFVDVICPCEGLVLVHSVAWDVVVRVVQSILVRTTHVGIHCWVELRCVGLAS